MVEKIQLGKKIIPNKRYYTYFNNTRNAPTCAGDASAVMISWKHFASCSAVTSRSAVSFLIVSLIVAMSFITKNNACDYQLAWCKSTRALLIWRELNTNKYLRSMRMEGSSRIGTA
jgi:hypothetical protein